MGNYEHLMPKLLMPHHLIAFKMYIILLPLAMDGLAVSHSHITVMQGLL